MIYDVMIQIPAACETGKFPQVKEFLSNDYFD